jgi:hypothetical protein
MTLETSFLQASGPAFCAVLCPGLSLLQLLCHFEYGLCVRRELPLDGEISSSYFDEVDTKPL